MKIGENDLISRAAAIAQIKENYCDWCDHTDLCQSCETRDCIATIEQQLPAMDAVPVVHGRWIYENEGTGDYSHCSECGCRVHGGKISDLSARYKYCPNCGAKMDGERRDDDAAD